MIVIDLKLDDGSVNPAFSRMEKVLEKLDKLENRLIGATNALAGAAKGVASGFSGAAAQANRATAAANRAAAATKKMPGRFNQNTISNPAAVLSQYGAAAQAGDPIAQGWVLAARGAINKQNRVNKALNGSAPPKIAGQQDPFLTALMRSRFVQQGGKMVGMPLGVDIMKLMGSGNSAGLASILNGGLAGGGGAGMGGMAALAGPVMLAVGAVALFAKTVQQGAMDIKSAVSANLMLGGSFGQSNAAMRAGRFAGVDPSSIMSNISGGGLPGSIAAGMGVSPVRGMFGDTNDAKAFLKIVRQIGNMSPEQARRYAIGLGDPNLAKFAMLNPRTLDRLTRSIETGASGKEQRASVEMDANVAIIGDSISRFARTIAGPFVRFGAMQLDNLGRILERLGNWAQVALSPLAAALQVLMDLYDAITGNNGKKNSAINENTKAIEDLNKTMKDGEFGGGERTRNARPRGMRGAGYEQNQQYRELRPNLI